MKKTIYILSFLFISCISFGQTKVVIRGNGGGGSTVAPTVTTSSATTLSLTTATTNEKIYVFTGTSAATWTLQAVNSASKYPLKLKNRGTASLTIQRAGSDNLFNQSAVTSIKLLTGDAVTIQNDGSMWIIY